MLDEKITRELIAQGRHFMQGRREDDPYEADFESDQDRGLPMPPLVKAPMRGEEARTKLTTDFSELDLKCDLAQLIYERRSCRVFTRKGVTLAQLSFLLWATQGVKGIRGKGYATLRTVPSGGARHEFETYLIIANVEGLAPGAYHYLPMEHAVEYLGAIDDIPAAISETLSGQKWSAKADVVFYWAMDARRAEWRYSIKAHRPALIDAGHVGQNLYIACTGLGLGTCGIAAFSHEKCAALFGLDGEDEYVVYSAPVGTVNNANAAAEERETYSFVYDKGL